MPLSICEIPSNLHLDACLKTPSLAPEVEIRIEEIWKEEKKRLGDRLFNGTFLNFEAISSRAIQGSWLPYKLYTAVKKDPSLSSYLKIEALGVMGLVHCPGFCLIGKRANFVMNYPSMYEIAPCGSLSLDVCKDYEDGHQREILQELFEETGISRSLVEDLKTFAIVKDSSCPILDLCVSLSLDSRVPLRKNDEYEELWWQSIDALDQFVEEKGSLIIPSTVAVLDFAKSKVWNF